MQKRPTDGAQASLSRLVEQIGPVLATVVGVLLIILGILVIEHPQLLVWVIGIGIILTGVAILASSVITAIQANGAGR